MRSRAKKSDQLLVWPATSLYDFFFFLKIIVYAGGVIGSFFAVMTVPGVAIGSIVGTLVGGVAGGIVVDDVMQTVMEKDVGNFG